MANLYGVANPVIAPIYFTTIGSANVNLVQNVETVIATSAALAAISSGVYYPAIFGNFTITVGAVASSGITFAVRIGAGADFFTQQLQATWTQANALLQYPLYAFGPSSVVPWQGAGSTISVTGLSNSTSAAIAYPGTYFWVSLYRAPDQ